MQRADVVCLRNAEHPSLRSLALPGAVVELPRLVFGRSRYRTRHELPSPLGPTRLPVLDFVPVARPLGARVPTSPQLPPQLPLVNCLLHRLSSRPRLEQRDHHRRSQHGLDAPTRRPQGQRTRRRDALSLASRWRPRERLCQYRRQHLFSSHDQLVLGLRLRLFLRALVSSRGAAEAVHREQRRRRRHLEPQARWLDGTPNLCRFSFKSI